MCTVQVTHWQELPARFKSATIARPSVTVDSAARGDPASSCADVQMIALTVSGATELAVLRSGFGDTWQTYAEVPVGDQGRVYLNLIGRSYTDDGALELRSITRDRGEARVSAESTIVPIHFKTLDGPGFAAEQPRRFWGILGVLMAVLCLAMVWHARRRLG